MAEQLVARYEAEKVALTSDLQAASATVIREQRRRTQLEEVGQLPFILRETCVTLPCPIFPCLRTVTGCCSRG